MNNDNGRGFIDTAINLLKGAADVGKVAVRALAGDIVGALKAAAQSPFIRKLIAIILVFILIIMCLVASLPSLLWSMFTNGDNATSEMQLRILSMTLTINDFFMTEYNETKGGLEELMMADDKIKTTTAIPPISPYQILAYYNASLINPETGEAIEGDTESDMQAHPPQIISGINVGSLQISDTAEAFREGLLMEATLQGIPDYIDILMAILMQESGGREIDVMQSGGSTYETSIALGVSKFKSALNKAGCTSPTDLNRLYIAMQAYNYGNGYITWLNSQGYTTWTLANAAEFSDKQLAEHPQWTIYGDKQYIPHVMRYYHSGGLSKQPLDHVNIATLIDILSEFKGMYFPYSVNSNVAYYEDEPENPVERADGERPPDYIDEYVLRFITDDEPDFFIELFGLTDSQVSLAATYESMFEQLGNTENAFGSATLKVSPLTTSEMMTYIAIAQQTEHSITGEVLSSNRKKVIETGLSLVGRVGYFWGGKSGTGYNENWGKPTVVSAAGDHTTGSIQPFGLDCSGFTVWAFNTALGAGTLSGGSSGQYSSTVKTSNPRPGDLGFMFKNGTTCHVGIYLGRDENGKMLWVHSQGGTGVCVGYCGFTAYTTVLP